MPTYTIERKTRLTQETSHSVFGQAVGNTGGRVVTVGWVLYRDGKRVNEYRTKRKARERIAREVAKEETR